MQDRRRSASSQVIYITADEAVARRAKELGSERAALEQLNAMVRSGRLIRYTLTIQDDGIERYEAVKGASLLVMDSRGRVSDLDEGDRIRFCQADINGLWPPPLEQVPAPPSPTRRKPGPEPDLDWRLWCAAQLIQIIVSKGGKLPPKDAPVARELLERLSDSREDDHAPDDSAVRRLVAQLLRPARDDNLR